MLVLPEDNGTGYSVLYIELYMADKSTWREGGTEKKRFFGHGGGRAGAGGAVVVGVGAGVGAGVVFQGAGVQGYNDKQRVFLCLFCCGLNMV